ncbi:MAG: glycosyltransferase family 39 protein [Anaerolineae bacterium]|nr:glycosyltransferase family 39 protein [Anaerolineae bacterium]
MGAKANKHGEIEIPVRLEIALLALILIVAAGLRLVALGDIPPGLQHDEVFHAHDAFTVLEHGNRALYFESNAGNEPLFVYLVAGTMALFGYNAVGIRMAAALCGLLTVVFVYLWGRAAWGARVGLLAAALSAVTFWPVFLSRVGLRAASLPVCVALTGWLFARALKNLGALSWVPAGAALGLTMYTYLAARVVPGVYALLFVLMLFAHRPGAHIGIRQTWRGWLLFAAAALVVAAPLALYLLSTPGAEARTAQLTGPLDALRAGDPGPVLEGALRTLGMFTFGGDPVGRYNVAGRPVFDWMVGLLFYTGLALSVWRWRDPQYAAPVLGLAVALFPSAVTPTPPSFLRAGAALPAAMLLPALGAAAIWDRLKGRRRWAAVGITAGLAAISGVLTVRDYFTVWPTAPDVIAVYRADLAEAAAWLEAERPDRPVVIGTSEPHHLDPFIFDYTPHGEADIRWVDGLQALTLPGARAIYISPATTPLNPRLTKIFFGDAAGAPVGELPDGAPAFTLYDLDASAALNARLTGAQTNPVYVSGAAAFESADPAGWAVRLDYPANLGGRLDFAGYVHAGAIESGGVLGLELYFRPTQDAAGVEPLAIFAHLLTRDGRLATGRDFLAAPARDWRAGEVFVQLHDLWIDPAAVPPGAYVLEIGVYSQADMRRFAVLGPDGEPLGDRLLLAPVIVE